jgi:choline dehydrogenase
MSRTRSDAVVVGGGTAGSVVAGRLVEAGLRVTVLEAGPDYGPPDSGRWPDDLLRASASLPVGHDWGYAGRGAGGQELVFERARVVGGCSSHNGCGLSVGWRGDYDGWVRAGCDGWSGEELTPIFARAAERMRVRRFGADEVQPFLRAYLDAAVAAGVPETEDLGDLDGGVGCGAELMNVVDGIRWNASFAYLDPVRDRQELEMIGEALVDRVLIDGDRAVGVRAIVAGEVREYRAELVVISAGAYGTPEVLLRSGIGPADEVRAGGVEARIDLPGVGANLHDQPAIELKFDGTSRLVEETTAFGREFGWLPEEQVMVKLASPECEGPYDLHVYPWMERDAARTSGWLCVIAVSLLTPRSRGRLRLRSNDPHVRAEVDHGFLTQASDSRALVPGLRWANEVAQSGYLEPYLGAALQVPVAHASDAQLIDWIRPRHAHYWHPAGTCRMGPETDPGAVVDTGGKVHGVDGLRVADASIFPELPRSTPTLPTVVLGERIAEAILSANGE